MAKWKAVAFEDVHKLSEGSLLRISEPREGKKVWGEVQGKIGKWEQNEYGVYETIMYLDLGYDRLFEHDIVLHPQFSDALYEVCIIKGLTFG